MTRQQQLEIAFLHMLQTMDMSDILQTANTALPKCVADVKRSVENAVWRRGGMQELTRIKQAAEKLNAQGT